MNEFIEKYAMILCIKHPKQDCKADFCDLSDTIKNAANEFNEKFKQKRITIESIEVDAIRITLESVIPVENPGREISGYSRILYSEPYNFAEYSTVENRLFKILGLTNLSQGGIKINNTPTYNGKITDEQMIKAIEFIVSMKDIGNEKNIERKTAFIARVKSMLDYMV